MMRLARTERQRQRAPSPLGEGWGEGLRSIVGASPLTRFAVQIDLSRSGEVYRTCGSTDSTKSHPALGAPGLAAETGQDLLQRITTRQSDHVAALQPDDRDDHRQKRCRDAVP